MKSKTKHKSLIIIGGGSGGLALAGRMARLGLQVGIIDHYAQLGGDCLHLGCVPSKTLLAIAKQGIEGDWEQIKQHINQVRARIQPRYSQQYVEQLGCEVVIGSPKFIDPNQVAIFSRDNLSHVIWQAPKIVIATGTRPMILPVPGLDKTETYTNETIYNLESLPKSMVIMGAGVTGIEFAQAFQRLGVKVTVLVHSERILRTLDKQASELLSAVLKKEGIEIYTRAKIKQATKVKAHKINLVIEHQDTLMTLETEVVFLATGRLPNIENLDLDQAGVPYHAQGIMVDGYFRTKAKHIYAIGDVIAWPHRYAHMAEYSAKIVSRHLYLKNFAPKANLNWVPGVIFTQPEIGSLGLTEQEAQEKKIAYDILYWEFKALDRAIIDSRPQGFIKLLLVKQKVVGATVVCERAGEILAELGLLMQKNLPIQAILETIHAYPTWGESLQRAIQAYLDKQQDKQVMPYFIPWKIISWFCKR